jgi:hypothetical protein
MRHQHADPPHTCHAAEQGHELATLNHSITSFARASSVGGTSRWASYVELHAREEHPHQPEAAQRRALSTALSCDVI